MEERVWLHLPTISEVLDNILGEPEEPEAEVTRPGIGRRPPRLRDKDDNIIVV